MLVAPDTVGATVVHPSDAFQVRADREARAEITEPHGTSGGNRAHHDRDVRSRERTA